jgi:pimeloyl-ACP methyl ester carboxylesterase
MADMHQAVVAGVGLEIQRIEGPAGRQLAPVVFLHEGLGSVAMWRDWPGQVCAATARPGLVYSRRGYGRSAPVPDVRGGGRHQPDYMHKEAFEVLPALLRELGIARPVLLGHSDGGTIALLHASKHETAACIVMAPHVIVENVSIASIEQARAAYVGGALRERLSRYHSDVDNAFWQWNDIWLDPAFRAFDIRDETRGTDDPYGTLRQIDEIGPTAGPLERVVLPDCGHSPHRDQPGSTLEKIAAFLSRHCVP